MGTCGADRRRFEGTAIMASNASLLSPACASKHPLELIPFFRRFRPSIPRDIVYTVIWNSLFAVFFGLLVVMFDSHVPIGSAFKATFAFAQCIGFLVYGGFFVGDRILGAGIHQAPLWIRTIYYAAIPIVAVMPGYLLASWILGWHGAASWLSTPRTFLSIMLVSLVLTGVLLLIFVPRERAARAEAAVAREQARVADAEKDTTTARMKLLEAQIEPHFLYNTLAHVVSLIDTEPGTAKHMIERLIALLRASAATGDGNGTLGGQAERLRAYLEIVELRMGERLRWRIDLPAALADLEVPPMLLQPIVENAVKHGLEPSVAGGDIAIGARREGATLVLTVSDSGRGFRETARSGVSGIGLANLRARLAASYGTDAALTIEDVPPHGTRVTITLPLARGAAHSFGGAAPEPAPTR